MPPGLIRRGLWLPGGIPRINDAHPAAASLEAAYLLGNGQPVALVPGYGALANLGTAPTAGVGTPGAYAAFGGAGGYEAVTGPSGDVSLVVVAMRGISATSGTAEVQVAVNTTAPISSPRNGLELNIGSIYSPNPATLAAQHFNNYPSNAPIAPLAIWIDGRKDATAALVSATALVNGVWYGIGVTISNLQVGQHSLTLGRFPENLYYLTGGIALVCFFRGILPDGLMCDLTDNPGGLFVWPEEEVLAMLGHNSRRARPRIFMH